jgi:hypothetical protein
MVLYIASRVMRHPSETSGFKNSRARSDQNQLPIEIQASATGADMDLRTVDDSELRFAAFVEGVVSVIGHADRARPLFDYCVGLIIPGERKSVEPMAAVTAPDRAAAQHQSLLHFVGQSPWSDEGCFGQSRRDGTASDRAPWTDRSLDRR